jgi:hypothetical protein
MMGPYLSNLYTYLAFRVGGNAHLFNKLNWCPRVKLPEALLTVI